MVVILRKTFSALFYFFEKGDDPFHHKPMNRKILFVVGSLFTLLATAILVVSPKESWGFLFPVVVFYSVGCVGLLIALAGTDRAVAKIWGNK